MHERSSGVLLHPTSLPGRFAVGDLGNAAEGFLDWLAAAGQSWWQVLPLGPPEACNSPYNCLSAFAGNPLLISPELLAADGLVDAAELEDAPSGSGAQVDFATATAWKEPLLRRAWERFNAGAGAAHLREELAELESSREGRWLADWTLFEALRRHYKGRGWWDWDRGVARRDPAELEQARRRLKGEIAYHGFVQFLFFRQWQRLRGEAARRGVRILGDLPIYVAMNSAEVWAQPQFFDLDEAGRPRSVAGVPPDYFSATGQLWGNPIYRWETMAEDRYAWWVERLAANLCLTDLVRLDHFRGFAGFWRVPAGEDTAVGGEWAPGPGLALFEALENALGKLPVIAEDLGDITPDVEELLDALGLPGMRVLQFGFDETPGTHTPHNLKPHCVVYSGTHDNDTIVGWYRGLDEATRQRVESYCGITPGAAGDVHWHLVRLALTSVAELAIVPAQDVLGLDGTARMNTPALSQGNWAWRLMPDQLTGEHAHRLGQLTRVSGRHPENRQREESSCSS